MELGREGGEREDGWMRREGSGMGEGKWYGMVWHDLESCFHTTFRKTNEVCILHNDSKPSITHHHATSRTPPEVLQLHLQVYSR